MLGEGYAKKLCPVNNGRLRASISHKRDDEAAYIGTNVEYGVYVELGTGQYYPGGRQTPWNYQDEKGDWHRTKGQKPQPYLKPAVANHANEYEQIIKDALKTE